MNGLSLRIFTEPQQGASYDDLLAVARRAEDLGFDGWFRSDHFLQMGDGDGLPGPTDAFVTLAGLARDTTRLRLGTLVASATFRLPGPLAVAVAQIDHMSSGRIELGLGAGWFAEEHAAYGIAFPSLGERFDRLEEQLAVITGLWDADGPFEHAGPHYPITASPALPKPLQRPHPPIIVGGGGPRRTPALAARYASEFNVPFVDLATYLRQGERVRSACAAIGRDGDDLIYSAALVICVGRTTEEFHARARAIGRDPDELMQNGICGTPDMALATIRRWRSAGCHRFYLQVLDLGDLDQINLIAEIFAESELPE
jgi:F420-dependent oxidoreductase-like protein